MAGFEYVYKALSAIGYTHPIHPPMTSLPLGMVMGALVFALLALASRRSGMTVTARHCIILALISVFPTMLLGYMDWHQYYGGAWLFPIKMKITLAISLILLLSFSIRFRPRIWGRLQSSSCCLCSMLSECSRHRIFRWRISFPNNKGNSSAKSSPPNQSE